MKGALSAGHAQRFSLAAQYRSVRARAFLSEDDNVRIATHDGGTQTLQAVLDKFRFLVAVFTLIR